MLIRSHQFHECERSVEGKRHYRDRPYLSNEREPAREFSEHFRYDGQTIVFPSAPAYYTHGVDTEVNELDAAYPETLDILGMGM